MTLESDLRELMREATKLALRDELPGIIREQLRPLLEKPTSDPLSEALSTAAAAAYAGVSAATVREWVGSGRLRAQRAGRLFRVRRSDLDAFLARSAPREGGVIDLSARARAILSSTRRSND